MERKRTLANRHLRQLRVRSRVRGTAQRPRLTVSVSNRHVSAQLIDDSAGKTLLSSTSVGQTGLKPNLSQRAEWVGQDIAKKAKSVKVTQLVFDRGSKLYHGRIAALAEAIRAGGVKF